MYKNLIKQPNSLKLLLVVTSFFVQRSINCTNTTTDSEFKKHYEFLKNKFNAQWSENDQKEMEKVLAFERALKEQVKKIKTNEVEVDEEIELDVSFSSVFFSAFIGDLEVTKYLIENNADLQKKTSNGDSALIHAAYFFLPSKSNLKKFDSNNVSKKIKIAKAILENKPDIINMQDIYGTTILMEVLESIGIHENQEIEKEVMEFIGYLLSMGADLESITNEYGETALDIAESVEISREELLKMKRKSMEHQQASNTTTKSNTNNNKKTNVPKPNNIISWLLIGGGVVISLSTYFYWHSEVKLKKDSELEDLEIEGYS